MKKEFKEAIEDSPIIAAIKDDEGLKKCLTSESRVIFILYGDICNIPDIVETVKSSGKIAMVHIDLIAGLSSKEIAVDFIQKYTKADGIITTKPALIKRAKELGLYTILRLFVIDSMAYSNIEHQLRTAKPDLIEVLPALMPKVLAKVCKLSTVPVIAGGLVSDKEDVMALLQFSYENVNLYKGKLAFLVSTILNAYINKCLSVVLLLIIVIYKINVYELCRFSKTFLKFWINYFIIS